MTEFDPDWCVSPGVMLQEWMRENETDLDQLVDATGLDEPQLRKFLEGRSDPIPGWFAERLEDATGVRRILWLNMDMAFHAGIKHGKTVLR